MKKIILTLSLISLTFGYSFAQLDSIYFLALPCNSYVGVTSLLTANPDSNATYYEWSVGSGTAPNTILFNGAQSPVQTTIAEVTLTFPIQQQNYVVCVTAFNASSNSNTYCDTLSGEVPVPVFSSSNSITGVPGDSGIYAVEQLICPSYQMVWTITGNTTFNNGGQTIITDVPDTSVNINFGQSFTAGNLCVKGVTEFGFAGDSVCLSITAFVGLDPGDDALTSFYYQPSYNQVSFNYSRITHEQVAVNLYDITGRLMFSQMINLSKDDRNINIPLPYLNQGIYMMEIAGKEFRRTLKFAKTE